MREREREREREVQTSEGIAIGQWRLENWGC